VVEGGEGLDPQPVLELLQLPDERSNMLLALAHEVRMPVRSRGRVSRSIIT